MATGTPHRRDAIGESVFALPGLQKLPVPGIAKDCIEKLAGFFPCPRTSRVLLESFSGIDVKAEKVAELLHANAPYEYLFMRNVQALSKREQVPHLESAVVMYGMQNSRNWTVALQYYRQIRGVLPSFDADGKLMSPPAEYLKHALRCEDLLAFDKGGYSDTAYIAGLFFDVLGMAALAVSGDNAAHLKAVQAYLEEIFEEGLACAKIAANLAKGLPTFSAKKYLFASCLLHDFGKVVMALLEPKYFEFLETAKKAEAPRTVRVLAEHERFGITHATLGAWLIRFSGLLAPVEQAVEFHHDPLLLRGRSKSGYQLAGLVSLAALLRADDRKPSGEEDPLVDEWLSTDLRDLGISRDAVASAKG